MFEDLSSKVILEDSSAGTMSRARAFKLQEPDFKHLFRHLRGRDHIQVR